MDYTALVISDCIYILDYRIGYKWIITVWQTDYQVGGVILQLKKIDCPILVHHPN